MLETPLKADFAIVRAWKADTLGQPGVPQDGPQLLAADVHGGARSPSSRPSTLSPSGELDPDQMHVPGIFVQRIIQAKDLQKWIERRTVQKKA